MLIFDPSGGGNRIMARHLFSEIELRQKMIPKVFVEAVREGQVQWRMMVLAPDSEPRFTFSGWAAPAPPSKEGK